MRFAVACTLALLMAPSMVSSTGAEPRDALFVSIYSSEAFGALVHWTPAPNAIAYAVFRGATPDTATYVGEALGTTWHDPEPLEGVSWYVIVSVSPHNSGNETPGPFDLGGYRGSCVNHRGGTGVSVTAAHCVPRDPL